MNAVRLKGFSKLRGRLLCRTALSGLAAVCAAPAIADTVTTVGTIANWKDSAGNNTTTPGTVPGLISDNTTTVTVSLPGARTILDWNSAAPLNIGAGKALSFEFLGRSNIVLNRIAAGSATINGTLSGTVSGQPGGNIWIAARDGIVFGNGAVVNTGGLLATTSPLSTTDTDFLASTEPTSGINHTFTFGTGTNSISIGDAHITVNGGLLAFIAPVVSSAANTAGNGVDGTGSVLYGAADAFKITLVPDGVSNWDLVSFEVPAGSGSSAPGTVIALSGTTNVTGSVYLAAVNSTLATDVISVGGTIATSAAVDDNGNIVLSAGHDIVNNAAASADNGGHVEIDLAGGGGLDAAGNVTLRAQDAITANGQASAAGTLTLVSGGAIAASGATLKAPTLTGSSAGAANLSNAGNVIATLKNFTNTSGPLTVRDSTALTVNGTIDVSGQTLTLNDTGGGINASGAVIKAATLTGSSARAAIFSNRGNVIGTLNGFTNTSGALTVRDSTALTVTGTIDTTGRILNLNDTGGGIDASGAVLKAATLTGSSAGAADFSNPGNAITRLGNFTNTSGALSVRDSTALTVTGTINATGQTLTLTDTGGGIDASARIIKAATLTGSSAGTANFSNAGNVIGTLNGFTNTAGPLSVKDSAPLTVAGTIDATGQTLTLNDTGGGIEASGAVIKAATLTGSSAGTADLSNAGNVIGALNGFSNTSGPLTVRDSTPLTVTGTVDASGQTLTLNDTGGGIDASGAVLKAASLTGSSAGASDLSNPGNVIATLSGFANTSGPLSVKDSVPLTVAGTVDASGQTLTLNDTGGGIDASGAILKAATLTGSSAGTADLSNAGNVIGALNGFSNSSGPLSVKDSAPLTVTGTVDASGQTLTLNDTGGGIDASGAVIKAATLTGSSAGVANFSNAGNVIGALNGFSNTSGPLSVKDSTALTVTGTVDASGQTLTLNDTGGGIDASGAVLKAATLTGSSAGAADLSNAGNVIGALNGFTNTSGPLTVKDSTALTVTGTVDASGQTLTLNDTGGGIDASGAVLKAATLTGSSAGAADLSNAGNVIATLNGFTNTSGALSVRDSTALTVTGTIDASGQTLTLNDTGGGIDASGAVIKAAALTGSSAGAADLSNAGNVIATLNGFSNTSGALSVKDSAALTVAGTIDATGQTFDAERHRRRHRRLWLVSSKRRR